MQWEVWLPADLDEWTMVPWPDGGPPTPRPIVFARGHAYDDPPAPRRPEFRWFNRHLHRTSGDYSATD